MNLEERQYVNIYQEMYKDYFKSVSKKKSIDAIDEVTNFLFLNLDAKWIAVQQLGSEKVSFFDKSHQYKILAFYGSSDGQIPDTQHLLKNSRIYWAIFGYLIENDEYPFAIMPQIVNSCELHNRKLLESNARTYMALCLTITKSCLDLYFQLLNDDMVDLNQLKRKFLQICKTAIRADVESNFRKALSSIPTTANGKIIIYRGFDIAKNKDVRLGRYKRNNHNFYVQDSCAGLNYTLSKSVAQNFAVHKFVDDSALGVSKHHRMIASSSIFDLENISLDGFTDPSLRRPYVAKYLVDSSDILLNISCFGESEIVLNPKDVHLVDYRPVRYS